MYYEVVEKTKDNILVSHLFEADNCWELLSILNNKELDIEEFTDIRLTGVRGVISK